MSFKPWLSKDIRDVRRSTARDYPPKKKKPWLAGSFPEMEHFNEATYRPNGYPVNPPHVTGGAIPREEGRGTQFGCCIGITASTVTDMDDIGTEGVAEDDDGFSFVELEVFVPGSVVSWSITPLGDTEGELAIVGNTSTILKGECPRATNIYFQPKSCEEALDLIKIIDDTGCEDGVYMSSAGGEITCSPIPSISGGYGITTSSTKQLSLDNSQGSVVWEISGIGASIDQAGLVTTTGAACGHLTITATDGCCGAFTHRLNVTDNGQWDLLSDTSYDGTDTCGQSNVDGYECTSDSGTIRTIYNGSRRCQGLAPQTSGPECCVNHEPPFNPEWPGDAPCAPVDPRSGSCGGSIGCGGCDAQACYWKNTRTAQVTRKRVYEWICP